MSIQAHRLFFPLALGQGALSVLAWTLAGPPGGEGAFWHAHEMVFGYGLAVVAGFLLTRAGGAPLLSLAGLWIAARIAAALDLPVLLPACLALASTAGIGLFAAATFLRGTKRGGNLVFPILMLTFPVAEAFFQAGVLGLWHDGARAGTWLGLGGLFMLIAAMGGRMIGAAASGALQRQGGRRLPPRLWLERAQMLALAAGMVMAGFGAPAPGAIGLISSAAGVVGLARISLWLPGLRRSPADIRALAVGQIWLGLGLIAFGAVLALDLSLPAAAALHLATIGGIGTTTLVMMIRATAQRDRRPMPGTPILGILALTGGAALARAFGSGAPEAAYPVAALLWALACLLAAFPGGVLRLR